MNRLVAQATHIFYSIRYLLTQISLMTWIPVSSTGMTGVLLVTRYSCSPFAKASGDKPHPPSRFARHPPPRFHPRKLCLRGARGWWALVTRNSCFFAGAGILVLSCCGGYYITKSLPRYTFFTISSWTISSVVPCFKIFPSCST